MSGMTDFTAENYLNYVTGRVPFPLTASIFMGLFTAAPTSDAGTGGTEVSGNGYARVQVAGQLAAGASWTTANSSITLGSAAPAWLLALGTNGSGVNVFDITNGEQIGTVSSISGTTVTLTANAAHASSGAADTLAFSAFSAPNASSGSEPSVTPAYIENGAVINFPQATGTGWGTVTSWALFDASSSGDMILWDYLGNDKWIPFTCTSASPGVLTTDLSGDVPANGTSCVVTSKFGGTLPTGTWTGLLTSAGASGNTFNLGVNTSSTGAGLFRQVASQPIAQNVTASIPANGCVAQAA